ncbi:MFS family permease [Bradyrhizobium sp. AZCC 1614]
MSEPARSSALAPFRVRNYRFQWPADLLTSWAFEMELIILGWYVLVETGSVLLLTVFASLGYVGTLVAPIFGVVGDRIGHRDLLGMMRATYAVLAAVLMALALSGHLAPIFVFVIAAVMGIVRPSDLGVRGALVATIMPHGQLIGAISISRTTMDTARIAGALSGAGLFASLGMGPAYVAIVCLYLTATALTLCIVAPAKPQLAGEAASEALQRSPLRDLKEGVAYVWTTPRMQAALWVAFLANLTAYPLSNGLLPYIAKAIYGTNQTGAWLSVGEFCDRLAGRFDRVEPDPRYPGGAADDRRDRRLVRDPAGVCADADGADRDRVPGGGGLFAKPRHDLDRRHPDADREREFPRPGDGCTHDGDLRPADRPVGRRQPDRRDRICRDRHSLRGGRSRADAGDRAALARRSLARACTGECAVI